jgi:hypothetical protein
MAHTAKMNPGILPDETISSGNIFRQDSTGLSPLAAKAVEPLQRAILQAP